MSEKTTLTTTLPVEHGTEWKDFFMCYEIATITDAKGRKYLLLCDGNTLIVDAKDGSRWEARIELKSLIVGSLGLRGS